MRTLFLLFLFGLNISCSQQNNNITANYKGFDVVKHNASISDLQGNWNSNELIEKDGTKAYFLYPINSNGYNYGNHISIKADQTFECFYTAFCGNDCFTKTKGKYKIIDKNYICFYLEEITKTGDCSENSESNIDLGLYFYYKKDKIFYLVKSNGNLKQDKKDIDYRDLITAKRKEIEKFHKRSGGSNYAMFDWKRTDVTDEKQIVANCMVENKIKNYELLYYDKGDKYSTEAIALVKINGEFRYMIYNTWGKPMTSLYNDSKVLQIDTLINKIDDDKSLKIKTFQEKNKPEEISPDKKTITVLKKGKEIYKVIYEKYPKDIEHSAVSTQTFYFQNSVPIYADTQYAFVGTENNRTEKKGLYVLDWENNRALIKSMSNGGMYLTIDRIKSELNRIMEEIKRQNL